MNELNQFKVNWIRLIDLFTACVWGLTWSASVLLVASWASWASLDSYWLLSCNSINQKWNPQSNKSRPHKSNGPVWRWRRFWQWRRGRRGRRGHSTGAAWPTPIGRHLPSRMEGSAWCSLVFHLATTTNNATKLAIAIITEPKYQIAALSLSN